ncbi:chromodomain-helicase-DNA-binding protein 9 isoform X3 [Syngnathoides biaculeatus]|uniref:chromodomain-helicase-DNA-binding protein 9 isoform X3 n=1 Tax=Syngnathoides biaculeatus TaxID=300417 RepID=UPI002ADE352C|nr:chromodomain-helicase-DNA-binding protein 9 isoform X3 [Syngnathoides biaculeatus]
MDFFDDPNLFGGGLEGVDVDGFPSAPSFVDELSLGPDFEPIQVEPLAPGKNQDMMLPVSSTSTQQAIPTYSQQMGHYIGIKTQNSIGQSFCSTRGTGGMAAGQQGEYHDAPVSQLPQANGLFFNNSSPMWGNQDQTGQMYHPLSQQQQQQQQQLYNQQIVRQQQTHHPQQYRMRVQQRQNHPQQIFNQNEHQQMNFQAISLEQRHHHSFAFHQGRQPRSQHQVPQSPQQDQHQLTAVGTRFHSALVPSQTDLLPGSCLQQQQPRSFSCGLRMAENNQPMDSSSLVRSLPTYSVSSINTYQAAQFPSYPGEPEMDSLSRPSLSSVSAAARPTATTTPHVAALPKLSGAACQFPSSSVNQAEECHFRALRCRGETRGNNKLSEIFGESMSCYPSVAHHLPSEQPQHCGDINTNGYPSLGDNLLASEAQDEHLAGLEPPDLLPDFLPQLEAALSQPDQSNCSWVDSNQAWGPEHRTQTPVGQKEEEPRKNTNGPASRVLSPVMKSSSSSSSSSSSPSSSSSSSSSSSCSPSEKTTLRQTHHQQDSAPLDKQEKANRIISEAIAKARQRGEKNIPRIMSPESFPSSSSQRKNHQDHKGNSKGRSKFKASRKACIVPSSTSKQKPKIGKIVIKIGKKKKRMPNSSEEESDEDPSPRRSSKDSKRRSNRQVKRKKYAEELEARLSDEDGKVIIKAKKTNPATSKQPAVQLFVENPSEEDAAVVDKIMSSRVVKKEVSPEVLVEVEEFFVKYKNYSYLHCEWATEGQLEKDKRIQQKIKRFKMKQAQRALFFADMEEELFNPDYVEVDRVLEVSYCEDKDTGEEVVYYLVKWCSLPYEDSTWELKDDVDQSKIEEFEQLQAAKPDSRRVERPPANLWKKREQSRQYRNGNSLRDYQLEGVNWLLFNWYNRRNCILADEMGLGKTIQSITFLEEIYRVGIKSPFLIIAPLSTIANWEREFRTWTHMNVIVYHGSIVSRQMLQQYEMYARDAQGRVLRGAYKFQAVITTFEMILGGCPELNAIEWRCVIIDEAHRLKNKNCKLLEGFKLMSLEHKVLLTGTPLQNTVEELFSLLHFLEPARFPSENTFMQEFGDLKTEEQVQKLQAILKPMMLRRLKEDVEKKLAPKEETIIEVELTNIQKKYYRAILEKNFSFLAKGAGQANMPNLVNTMMELRKCCNHPYLIKGAEEKILEDFREVYSPAALDFHLQAMVQSAGKLVLIDKLLPKMKAGGHKVLIFSQMVRCLDILEDYLIQRRYLYERIDGRVRGNLRQAAIDRFSKPDSDRFVFLLCTRAGGLGINLTAADTCIIFDSDWNPQNDLQAQARCHRIGQNKAVKVYRLITRNSYEREMFDRASLKLGLDKAVLQSMSGRDNSLGGGGAGGAGGTGGGAVQQQLSKKEIEDLLRRGAYGAIMDEEDEGAKFCEEDIDQILQRRTKTITIESEGRGSTFAKASFVASGNRTDISLDDPNFWDKWAKKADIDMEMANGRNSLVIDTPRVRKQTRPFSSTKDELAELSEGESDSDDAKPKVRRAHERPNSYGRTECFRVEKNLLVYGWGRWKDILNHGRFKKQLTDWDVESICRALLAYCLVHYRGDDKIKGFMWDLIAPTEDGQTKELQNHLGLSAPVPRGRKGKKMKTQSSSFDIHKAEWLRKHNPEHMLQDDGYKKHLKHHCNKVLLRVRMLYYLKQEVIGDEAQNVLNNVDASEIKILVPELDHSELPALWWDSVSDKCLLLGVYKHGYEKYNTIRADPALCFLERVGRPDDKAIAAEQRSNDFMDGDVDDPEYKPAPALLKDDIEDDASSPGDLVVTDNPGDAVPGVASAYWPSSSLLTARLRRLITASQRYTKSRQILQIHQVQLQSHTQLAGMSSMPLCPPPPSAALLLPPAVFSDPLNTKMAAKIERQQRWTRREEADFYRVVSTFGVVFNPTVGRFDWTKFRAMARLHKKTDESLQKYLCAFAAMCRRVCRLPPKEGDSAVDPSLNIQPITEERASRTLYRVELLRQVREQVLRHPLLYERLQLCQISSDLPAWWESGTHDRDLLIGAAKHGVSRTDYHILRDPDLGFMAAQRNYSQTKAMLPQQQQQQLVGFTPVLQPQYQPSAVPLPTPRDLATGGVVPKAEPSSEGEESREKAKESWSPARALETPAGVAEDKRDSEGQMVAARTKPVTPNSLERKPKKASKRGRRERRPSGSDSDGSSSSSSSRSSSSSSSTSSSSSRSGSSSSSSSSSCSSGSSSSSSSSSTSSDDSDSEGEDRKKKVLAAPSVKVFDEDSVASLGATHRDAQDTPAPQNGVANNASHPFQAGGFMLAASHWPKDRVIINRLDSICQAVLKGKWPATRRVYEPGGPVASFYTTKLLDGSLCEDPSASPQGSKQEGGLKLTFQKQGLPLKRPLDSEEAPQAQQQQYLARLHELQNASDTGLADITQPQCSFQNMPSGLAGAMRLNGVLDSQPVVKRRRGRRKNVEGVDLLFMNRSQVPDQAAPGWGGIGQVGMAPMPGYNHQASGPSPENVESRVPVINLKDGTRLAGDDAPRRKDLNQWLQEHPGFVADTGAFIPGVNKMPLQFHVQDGRPKQKRHRCRNPNKIDVNSLTGEERVQIINRRNARKVGGAFAPPLKDLCRFLQENPEYGVPPEWGDVVKQSGYLPASMFDRILTGPIVPEEVSRRGRRPKNPLVKAATMTPNPAAAASSTLALNPLLANGLLAGMDLSGLQAFQQNLQLTAGLMGLPPSDAGNLAASNLAAMFPMMLSGMAGLPNLLGMSALLGKNQDGSGGGAEDKDAGTGGGGPAGEPCALGEERTEGGDAPASSQSASSTSSPPLPLNPLLLSSMLYPGMLLTPGLNLPVANAQPDHKPLPPQSPPPLPQAPAAKVETLEDNDDDDDDDDESGEPKDQSRKPESSSSESGSSSSSSDDSDSSKE